jgi:anti-sigma regulatory factor (Ser/Thr protein kinase)
MTTDVFTFAPTIDAPAEARRALDAMAFGNPPADDLSLAVSELVTNSVRHGEMPEGTVVEMSVHRSAGSVRIEVRNPGRGVSIATARQGGRGFMIIDAVAERWGIRRDDQTCVWFEMPLL